MSVFLDTADSDVFFQTARKRLETRRLAFDASQAKIQKSKKDDFRMEEELRSQRAKYDEASDDVHRRMLDIKEAEVDSINDLTTFLDAELAYYDRAREVLMQLRRDWPAYVYTASYLSFSFLFTDKTTAHLVKLHPRADWQFQEEDVCPDLAQTPHHLSVKLKKKAQSPISALPFAQELPLVPTLPAVSCPDSIFPLDPRSTLASKVQRASDLAMLLLQPCLDCLAFLPILRYR